MSAIDSATALTLRVGIAASFWILSACGSPVSHAPPAIGTTPEKPPPTTNSVEPVGSASEFCRALFHAGVVNTAALQESSDPSAMLNALDPLVAEAPDDIAADFAVFVQVERAMLDPGAPSDPADLTSPGIRSALSHVATYLRDTCHLT